MVTFNSTQVADLIAIPAVMQRPRDLHGRVRVGYFNYTVVNTENDGDIIRLVKLPKGCRVLDFFFYIEDAGVSSVVGCGITGDTSRYGDYDAEGGDSHRAVGLADKVPDDTAIADDITYFVMEVESADFANAGSTIIGWVQYSID